jgi:L-alanine-DL-glutamate epimerase-like enolase superfamily enzyme
MTALLQWSRATVLSLAEFEVSWELLRLGETPVQLDPPSAGRTMEERRRIVAEVTAGLHRRGLGDGRGPHPVLAERLRLLATGDELDVRFRADTLVAAVAACHRDRCTLAVRHAGEIALLDLHADEAGAALVELIGPVVPGPGRAVHLPAGVLDAVRAASPRDPHRFTEELIVRGVDAQDATLLVQMCSGARHGGQLGATTRRTAGRRRAPHVIGVHRTDQGCYRQVRRAVAGRATVTVAPVDGPELVAELAALGSRGASGSLAR